MVSGAVPLVVNIFVAALAGVGLHEELAGNFFSAIDLRGAGEECAVGAVAFTVHGKRRERRIFNAAVLVAASFAEIAGYGCEHCQHSEHGGNSYDNVTRQALVAACSSRAPASRGHQARA